MITSTVSGAAVLEWWTYLVMALVVAVTMGLLYLVVDWYERRIEAPGEDPGASMRRCVGLVHAYNLGRPAYIWCHMPAGHSGPHRDEYGSSEEDYRLRPATQQDGDTMSLFLDRIQRQAYGGE